MIEYINGGGVWEMTIGERKIKGSKEITGPHSVQR